MAKTKISEYSSTASNNTDVDGINIAEGMAPSNVNNAMREIMAQLKDWQSGAVAQDMNVNGALTVSGNAVMSADLSVGDDLTVTGDASIGGAFTCTGAAVLGSNLSVTGAATITGNLNANGTSSLGATTFSGAVIMSSNVTVDGNATLNGNITAGSNTSDTVTLNALLSAGGGTGTSGQFLKSRGTSDTPVWDNTLTSETAKSATSTSVDFTGIPSWVKRITVMFNGVSTSGASSIQLQIGDAGGIETTGYLGTSSAITTAVATINNSSGWTTDANVTAATSVRHGSASIYLQTTDLWVCSGTLGHSDVARSAVFAGSKTLSGTLDRIRITTVNGTDTFDAGSINILYE